MIPWVRRFQRAARHKPTLWGLNNYLDANRLRTTGTRRLLAAVKGRVWITETGGLVRRKHYRAQISFPESAEHAGKVTRFLLRFANAHTRIRRVYIYQWNANSLFQTWDSGIIDPFGQRRAALPRPAPSGGRPSPPPRAISAPPRSAPRPPRHSWSPPPRRRPARPARAPRRSPPSS